VVVSLSIVEVVLKVIEGEGCESDWVGLITGTTGVGAVEGVRRVEGTKTDLMRTANDAIWIGVVVQRWMVAVRGAKAVYIW